MTRLFPIAAPIRVLLLDIRVTSSSARRPRYPICGTPRRPPWLRAWGHAEIAPAILRIPVGRIPESHPGFPSAPSTAEHFSPRSGIKIALVVGQRLRFGLEHIRHQVQHDG